MTYPLKLYLFPCVALEDDTDELLELIGKSDRLLTPTKHHRHTPGLLVKKQLGSSPYSVGLHSSESHSNSDTDSHKSTRFCDEAEAYGGLKVKGNFTPAPVVSQPDQPHSSNSAPPQVPASLKELVQLMQGYADKVMDIAGLHIGFCFLRGGGKEFYRGSWIQLHEKTFDILKYAFYAEISAICYYIL